MLILGQTSLSKERQGVSANAFQLHCYKRGVRDIHERVVGLYLEGQDGHEDP